MILNISADGIGRTDGRVGDILLGLEHAAGVVAGAMDFGDFVARCAVACCGIFGVSRITGLRRHAVDWLFAVWLRGIGP